MEKINIFNIERRVLVQVLFTFFLFVLIISCGTGKNTAADRINEYEELKELVNSGKFEIENQWAYPLTGNMIDLIGNPNYIRIKNDSVNVFLPYFGVRHAGGNYGGRDGGITYKGIAEELEIKEAEDDSKIMIHFETAKGTENYTFTITLFPNGNASTQVSSSERSAISYRGMVEELFEGAEFKNER